MQAFSWCNYGSPDVLELGEFDKPVPKRKEVLIKIYASSVTAGDCRLRACKVPMGFWLPTRLVFGFIRPRKLIPGMDISGVVEAVGDEVSHFKVGDKVYGSAGIRLGANAEYICLPETSALVKKPGNLSHEQSAAVIFGGLAAIHFLKDKLTIKRGQKILVNGASGAVGCALIQLANYYGTKVTGVCSTSSVALVKSLGAVQVIDYTRDDVSRLEERYDVIIDAVGNWSCLQCGKWLKKQGKLVLLNTGLLMNLLSMVNKQLVCGVAGESKANLNFLKARVEAGDIKPLVDRIYPLARTAEAHSYVDKGHKKGSVVISVNHEHNADCTSK